MGRSFEAIHPENALGSQQETIIKNWYNGSSRQLAAIIGSDGYTLDTSIQTLVQAMASFQAASHTSLTDGSFGAVATMAAAAWHK